MSYFPIVFVGLKQRIEAERDRWPLWYPVLIGVGIGLYFSLPTEPNSSLVIAGLVLSVAMAWWGLRRQAGWSVLLVVISLVLLGMAAVTVRSASVAAPALTYPSGKVALSGTVKELEPYSGGQWRVILTHLDGAVAFPLPQTIRVRLKSLPESLRVGSRMTATMLLMPPSPPTVPDGFDFARQAWFSRLGAVGSILDIQTITAGDGGLLNHLRARLIQAVLSVLPSETAGIAVALLTGETGAIPQPLLQAYRDAGIAHLLAISGLHMGLLAGLIFLVVRGGLALLPQVSETMPIKTWAAAVALLMTLFYVLLAGAPVSAVRAFVMLALALIAVMIGRNPLSMRLVAWAAVAVLLLMPEVLIQPGFQMSFAAVVALIAAYEHLRTPLSNWQRGRGRWTRVVLYGFTLTLSSLLAGSATAVYALYHFDRMAVWSLAANLLAVPITGFLVMPMALLAALAAPLGLESVPLAVMGIGIDWINQIATTVAHWPYAVVSFPAFPLWGLGMFTVGALWLTLWQGRWRWWGIAGMVIGLGAPLWVQPPDILLDGRGKTVAVRLENGSLLLNRGGGKYLRDHWSAAAGPLADLPWPKRGSGGNGVLSCDESLCFYRWQGQRVAVVLKDDGVTAACASPATLVVSLVPIRILCPHATRIVDRFDVWRFGAHSLRWDGQQWQVRTVQGQQGDRPWSYRPVSRKARQRQAVAGNGGGGVADQVRDEFAASTRHGPTESPMSGVEEEATEGGAP